MEDMKIVNSSFRPYHRGTKVPLELLLRSDMFRERVLKKCRAESIVGVEPTERKPTKGCELLLLSF